MNYETLYTDYLKLEKTLKDTLATQQKTLKRLSKNIETGDLKTAAKDLTALAAAIESTAQQTTAAAATIDAFDAAAYMQSGTYAEQLIALCNASDIDIKGEGSVYEVFPYKVKLDADALDVYIDRKRCQTMRPAALVGTLKSGRDKLMKAAFSPTIFAEELAAAYDLAVLRASKTGKPAATDPDLYLTALYKDLTPMRRFRRDYDLQSFAFDLARLYASDTNRLEDGRHIQFGPSRSSARAIRILDGNGQEQYLATVRFYVQQEE